MATNNVTGGGRVGFNFEIQQQQQWIIDFNFDTRVNLLKKKLTDSFEE